MKLKAMTLALFAVGLLAGLTLIAPATGADPPTTTTTQTVYTTATDPITALSSTSITVGPLTCSIGSSSPKAGDFKVGDRARIYCANGVLLYLIRPDTPTTTTPAATTTTTTKTEPNYTSATDPITALSSTSITVGPLTCSIGSSSPKPGDFKVGDQVGIGCSGGVLVKIGTPQLDDGGFKVVVQLGPIVALNADSITVGKVKCSLATTSPSVASYEVGDRVGIGCAGGILFMIGALPSMDRVPKTEVKYALVKRFNGCIKHGAEKCTVKGILHRLVQK